MARPKSASIQARHAKACSLARQWTNFESAHKSAGCTCRPTYYLVSRPDGKQIRDQIGHDRQTAARKLSETLVQIDEGTHAAPSTKTFEEWSSEWIAGLKRPKTSTIRSYGATLNYARRAFGTAQLRHVNTADVVRFLELIAEEGSGTSTQALHLRVLHSCLETARRQQPPLVAFNAAELPDQQRPQVERKKASAFDDDELKRLWTKLPEPYLSMCKLSAATGLRQAEIIGLTWGDVDFEEKLVRVRQTYTTGIGFQRPKSATSERQVVLAPKAVDLLRARKDAQSFPAATALVFPGQGRDGQIVDSTLRTALYEAMTAAGVPREWKPGHKERNFHSLRHSFARAALGAGLSLEWIAEQLGHSSISVTERAYHHFRPEARHQQAAQLDQALYL